MKPLLLVLKASQATFRAPLELRLVAFILVLLPPPLSGSLLADELQPVIVRGFGPGPGVSAPGGNDHSVSARDISNLPQGENSNITDVLTQMPGVAIDQNPQIHLRNTERPQFQHQINGILVPLDVNANPAFISIINPLFVQRLSLFAAMLPARDSYAAGGVVGMEIRDGFEQPGGSVTFYAGQRDTIQPSVQDGGQRR